MSATPETHAYEITAGEGANIGSVLKQLQEAVGRFGGQVLKSEVKGDEARVEISAVRNKQPNEGWLRFITQSGVGLREVRL